MLSLAVGLCLVWTCLFLPLHTTPHLLLSWHWADPPRTLEGNSWYMRLQRSRLWGARYQLFSPFTPKTPHKSWVSSIPKPLVSKQNVCTHPQQELIAWSKLLKSCILSASARHRPGAGRQHHCPFKQHVTYIWRLCKGATASSNLWAYVEELCHRNKSYHFRSHNKQLQLWTSPRRLLNYYLGQAEVHLVKIELPFFERRHKCFSLHCSYHCWGNQAGICFQ